MSSAERSDEAIVRELRLRGDPPSVTRLSRKAVMIAAATLALGIAGVAGWSLMRRPPTAATPAASDEGQAAAPPRQVAELPKDYAALPNNTPRLGPPLPGDLGRPFLEAKTQAAAPEGTVGPSLVSTPDPAFQQAQQEAAQARRSRLTVQTAAAPRPAPAIPMAATPSAPSSEAGPMGGLEPPKSPYLVQAGSVVRAALITAVRSDLAGPVTAQVTEDVFDSLTGRFRLIPQGSRLIGGYESRLGFGQDRLQVSWTRLILPNGRSIELGHEAASDAEGLAGVADHVDRHWRALIGGALVSSLLGVGVELGAGPNDSRIIQGLRTGAANTASQAGEQLVGKSLGVQPTITLRAGLPVQVIVTKDLVLEPWPS